MYNAFKSSKKTVKSGNKYVHAGYYNDYSTYYIPMSRACLVNAQDNEAKSGKEMTSSPDSSYNARNNIEQTSYNNQMFRAGINV